MAIQDDSFNKFFGWQSAGGNTPTSATGTRDIGQDIVQATFDPQGAAHTKYEADKAAEEQAKVKAAADQAKYQQDLQVYQQESARIAADNAKRLQESQAAAAPAAPAAPLAPNPYASFYGLTARQQQKVSANPRIAQRRGISLPPAGYTAPEGTAAAPATGSNPWAQQKTAAAFPTGPVAPESLWQSKAQYTAANPTGDYNKYAQGLPLIYQDLINYGVSPEQVASGQAITLQRQYGQEIIPTDYNEAMRIYGTTRGGPSDLGVGLNIWTPTPQYDTPAAQYAKLPKV